jgi:arginine:ornithine antiporter/lysine permease
MKKRRLLGLGALLLGALLGHANMNGSAAPTQKMALPALTAMMVGSMIGSGIFMLPRRFGDASGVFGALIAWAVAGGDMFTLARVFQSLARRKPDLDAGVYALVAGWISI